MTFHSQLAVRLYAMRATWSVIHLVPGMVAVQRRTHPSPRGATINSKIACAIAFLLATLACTSSGKTPADILEIAQPSIVRILTATGSGTGFIVSKNGLVVTNRHVVEGNRYVVVRLATGEQYEGKVTQLHAILDMAYVEIDSGQSFTPLSMGDSSEVSVSQAVFAVGYPLADDLGLNPTISKGIISAMRDDYLQTDASLNPGNSGGPLLTEDGKVIGLISARAERTESGRAVAGIGFAIPINDVKPGLPAGIASGNPAPADTPNPTIIPDPSPTPPPTVPPTLAPTPDVQTTREALEAADTRRRAEAEATRVAEQAEQDAEKYAAALEATRIAELPTPTPTPTPGPTATPTHTPTPTATPTPEPTPTPLPPTPTATPHPATFCEEWEAMVLEWVKQGNHYPSSIDWAWRGGSHTIPGHSRLSAIDGHKLCIQAKSRDTYRVFPLGILGITGESQVGTRGGQLLPGLYEYRSNTGDNRLPGPGYVGNRCTLRLDISGEDIRYDLPYEEPFTFRFFEYHGKVNFFFCGGALYRSRD